MKLAMNPDFDSTRNFFLFIKSTMAATMYEPPANPPKNR